MNLANLQRRDFLKLVLAGGSQLLFPISGFSYANAATSEPHFFIQMILLGGLDINYLFDARPLSMTQANLIQNYLNEEPTPWQGSNGVSTLASSLTQPLKTFQNDFTLLNGVFMAPSFDGHEQNLNYLLTGNPFGGDGFIPHLNQNSQSRPIDGIQAGRLYSSPTNSANIVPMDYASLVGVVAKLQSGQIINQQQPIWRHITERFLNSSEGTNGGRFTQSSQLLGRSLGISADLEKTLKQLKLNEETNKDPHSFFHLAGALFKSHVSRSAIYIPEFKIQMDCHDAPSAKKHPALVKEVVSQIISMIQYLKSTPYDATRSLYDVTTFMVTSEFARTLRQPNTAIDNTGTDHNNLTNTVLMGGKGIRTGQVIGASDFQTKDWEISKAHLQLDSSKLKIMAQPFDFTTSKVRTDLPEFFDMKDYVSINSVVNSVYQLFGVSKTKYRTNDRSGASSPVLSALLK
ncbi:MAG: DUF1501 domain-containing protein [Bdellovibrionales bacterium]